jgi:hypothetical protein
MRSSRWSRSIFRRPISKARSPRHRSSTEKQSRRGRRHPLWVEYGPIRVKRSLDMTHMQKTEWPAKST